MTVRGYIYIHADAEITGDRLLPTAAQPEGGPGGRSGDRLALWVFLQDLGMAVALLGRNSRCARVRDRQTDTETDWGGEREREGGTDRQTDTETDWGGERERERERERDRQTDRQTDRH